MSRSFDKGETWETHYVIQDDPAVFHDKEWIAVAPDGTVYVAWALFKSGRGGPAQYLGSPIVIGKSTDQGQTWSEPQEISAGPYAPFATRWWLPMAPSTDHLPLEVRYGLLRDEDRDGTGW